MPASLHNLRWCLLGRALPASLLVFMLGSLSDLWLRQHADSLTVALLDDALVGMAVGVVVFLYERRERQRLISKLETVRLMNHYVRNSLQVICYAASVAQREELAKNLNEAVERIEWALDEVLPGQRKDLTMFIKPTSHTHSEETERVVA